MKSEERRHLGGITLAKFIKLLSAHDKNLPLSLNDSSGRAVAASEKSFRVVTWPGNRQTLHIG